MTRTCQEIISREALPFPSQSDLDAETHSDVVALQAAFQAAVASGALSLATPRSGTIASAEWRKHEEVLKHPLSDHWMNRRRAGVGRELRAQASEDIAYAQARSLLLDALKSTDPGALVEATERLCDLHMNCSGTTLRTHPVGLDPDADGTRVVFGDWRLLPSRLRELKQAVATTGLPPAMKAVATLAVFLNIHPLADGNGRCARAWFNAVLASQTGMNLNFIALRPVFDASIGGFEIRLREAELNRRWRPLAHYFRFIFEALALEHGAGRNGLRP